MPAEPRVIRVVDFETDGGEPPEACIIEVGWCDIVEVAPAVWRVNAPRAVLCRPTRPIKIEAMAVHHLTPRDLEDAVSAEEALAQLHRAGAAGPVVAYAAHNAETEKGLWPAADADWVDTYKLALRLWPDSPKHSLQLLRYYTELTLNRGHSLPAHRAGPDAFVTAALLAKALEQITVAEALEISEQQAILPRVPFGMHFGRPWSEMDSGFLHWVLGKDFREDVMNTARHHLELREAEYQRHFEEQRRLEEQAVPQEGLPF